MMKSLFPLEAFDPPEPAEENAGLEELRVAAYEQGYAAGWEDAITAQEAEGRKLRADLGRNLQALAFTYHEARGHVLRALEPLLRDMISRVLPELARATLAPVLAEKLSERTSEIADTPVTVICSPASLRQVEALLSVHDALPLRCIAEPSLSDGQAFLRLGDIESRIDLDAVIAAMGEAVESYFSLGKEGDKNEQ